MRNVFISTLTLGAGAVLAVLTSALIPSLVSLVDSDALYLPALYRDIFVDGSDVLTWNFPPAPYFFPDMPVMFVLLLLVPELGLAFGLWAVIFVAGFVLVCFLLLTSVDIPTNKAFLGALLIAVLVLASVSDDPVLLHFLMPTYHGSTFLVALMLLVVAKRLTGTEADRVHHLLFGALIVVSLLSDQLILVQGIIPLGLTFLWLLRDGARKSQARRVIRTVLLSVILWIVISAIRRNLRFLNIPGVGGVSTDADQLAESVMTLASIGSQYFREHVIHAVVLLCSVILAVVQWTAGFRRQTEASGKQGAHDESRMVILYLLLVVVCTLIGPTISGQWRNWASNRYLFPIYVIPFCLLAIMAFKQASLFSRRIQIAGIIAVMVIGIADCYRQLRRFEGYSVSLRYPGFVRGLDSLSTVRGSKYGLGGYWYAKSTTMLSRSGIRVNQIGVDLAPFPAISNSQWFEVTPDGRFFNHGFIITNDLPRNAILTTFGKPAHEARWDTIEVFFYDRPSDTTFARWARSFHKRQEHIIP